MNWNGFEVLEDYVQHRISEFDNIDRERKDELIRLSGLIRKGLSQDDAVQLIFICTHNSRRSHMGQLWAQLAAKHYNIARIRCFSGGTRTTAFDPRAVKALQNAGMKIVLLETSSNPSYSVTFCTDMEPMTVFSKKYADPPNPTTGFIAVITCSEADKACPVVFGASSRCTIRYVDPKAFDGTPEEEGQYAGRSRQIAREMLFLLSVV